MKKYINTITGVVFETNSICRGENWREVNPPAKAPAQEKILKSKDSKISRKGKGNELRNS